MDTSRNRIRRMVGLLWFCFFFAAVLAEGTLEKLHEDPLHFNQASRSERLTGPQTRLTAIVPSVYTTEPLEINNATSMISNAPAGPRLLLTAREKCTTGRIPQNGMYNQAELVGREIGGRRVRRERDAGKCMIVSRERHTVITGNADGDYADGRHRQSAI
ncbi:Uncharacterized protein DBV15_01654 [Temnothorax longispinosus]|uniref:Uncharacterized protein n=1 Tax=Temnothorax longispinosus TaxID=300112 RepID=A0A4S2L0R3_9HYME|nr:Uncharacterized protein DBV15_01654 [Temnothorax longispinosus]